MLQLLGQKYPVSAKQDPHTRPGITGTTQVLTINLRAADIPEDKLILWEEKGYTILNQIAAERCSNTGEPYFPTLKKVFWYNAFNQPKVMVVYTGRTDDLVMGMIKFLLTHGTTVVLTDRTMQLNNKIIYPVTNIYTKPLFKKYKVEEIDLTTLKRIDRLRAKEKLQILNDARAVYMNTYVWPVLNEDLKEITDFYREENAVQYWEFLNAEAHANLEDLANVLDYETPDAATLEQMVTVVNHWGPAFGITPPLPERVNTIDQFHESREFKHRKGWTYSRTMDIVYSMKNKQRSLSDPAQILRDYETILWYLDNNPAKWLDPAYTLCEACGDPVHENAEFCSCGRINDNMEYDHEWVSRNNWEFTEV